MQGRSQRAAAKHFGVSRNMVATLLREPAEGTERRYTRRKAREAPARERIRPHIEGWLKENEGLQRWAPKQRWTAHRMWVELGRQGITVGESTVRLTVRQLRGPQKRTAYVPLSFDPGERAEFDFGHAVVVLDGSVRIRNASGLWRASSCGCPADITYAACSNAHTSPHRSGKSCR